MPYRILTLRVALAALALGMLSIVPQSSMPTTQPMTWEETLRTSVDKDHLTAAQVAELGFHDVCGRLGTDGHKPVPKGFFYQNVRNKTAAEMAREDLEAKRAALVAETINRLKTLPDMADVTVQYEDGRLVITGGAVTEIKR